MTVSRTRSARASYVVRASLGLAILMLVPLLVGFAYELYWGPLEQGACAVLNVIVAFGGAFSTYFMGGSLTYSTVHQGRVIRAAGGIAVFILLYVNPPFPRQNRVPISITIDRLCGFAPSARAVISAGPCEADGSVTGLDAAAEICANVSSDALQEAPECTLPSGGVWHFGPFQLRIMGQTSGDTVELRVVARDRRNLHLERAAVQAEIVVPAPSVSISSVVPSSFCVYGKATNLRTDETIVLEMTPLSATAGTWYLQADLVADDWSACDHPDLRVPSAAGYRIVVWIGAGPSIQRLSKLPSGFARLSSYSVNVAELNSTSTVRQVVRGEERQ